MNQSLTFVIFGTDPEALKELGGALAAHERVRLMAGNNQAKQICADVARLRPSAVIVTFSADPTEELALIKQLAAECPETMLIGAAFDASPDLILNSLHSGAQEFLRLPVIAAEFEAVVGRAAEFAAKQTAQQRRLGRVIAVYSNKGGCGTSFLAANLAVALGAPTALVDLNLQTGDLGFFFHIARKFSITNLIENLARMDEALLSSLLMPYSPSVSLLPAPRDVEAAIGVKAEQVREVLELLRKQFDYVVIDLAHIFDEVTLAALDLSDEILLVLTPDVMAIRSAQRALGVFDRLDYPQERVRIVVNRWSKKSLNLDWEQIERFLSKRPVSFMADDPQTVVHSINIGKPLVETQPSSPVSMDIWRLAQTLAGKSGQGGQPAKLKAPSLNGHAGALNGAATNGLPHGATPPLADAKTWKGRLRSVFSRN